eukprot:m51a1_g11221 putative thioesterase involved in non-ribosomal peptide synthesis (146) ;mRNA; r:37163-37827
MNEVEVPVLRVFCIPFHLGGPSAFAMWAEELQRLAPRIALLVARIPCWETRESDPLPMSLGEVISPMADAVSAIVGSDDIPYVVYGHSVGGLFAFELRVSCPVTAFIAGADDVYVEDSVRMWAKFAPAGSFSAIELGPNYRPNEV